MKITTTLLNSRPVMNYTILNKTLGGLNFYKNPKSEVGFGFGLLLVEMQPERSGVTTYVAGS